MFLLIFRFSGEDKWNHREIRNLCEIPNILAYWKVFHSKKVKEWEVLAEDKEICEFLGVSVEMCEDRHEKVVWS